MYLGDEVLAHCSGQPLEEPLRVLDLSLYPILLVLVVLLCGPLLVAHIQKALGWYLDGPRGQVPQPHIHPAQCPLNCPISAMLGHAIPWPLLLCT